MSTVTAHVTNPIAATYRRQSIACVPSHVIVETGLPAGLLGCVLAVLGIFTLGFVFVPLAALCVLVALLRDISSFNASGIGTPLLAACYAFLDSQRLPSCWALSAAFW